MIEEKDGWFVKNVREATWVKRGDFGRVCAFDVGNPFPQTGVHVFVLEPGRPNCRYHREATQEDFLVLSGRCRLLVNGEERMLDTWDFVHCPAGTSHVFVGIEGEKCALLAIGDRPEPGTDRFFYPESELARRYGAESPEPTSDPRVAYSDVAPQELTDPPEWPLD